MSHENPIYTVPFSINKSNCSNSTGISVTTSYVALVLDLSVKKRGAEVGNHVSRLRFFKMSDLEEKLKTRPDYVPLIMS